MNELRFRQIHLDFHTSEKIMRVGNSFNPQEFASRLKKSHVNSVTCFARCHHGMLYFKSKAFPELIHPGLSDPSLLEKQIEACHKENIKVPIYTTVQWDYHTSMNHPEWCCLTPAGGIVNMCEDVSSPVYEPGFYRTLCVNTPYKSFLKEHIKDIFDVIGVENIDGFFLDIVNVTDCSCHHCVTDMVKEGYNPESKEERVAFAGKMLQGFKEEMSEYIRSFKQDITIFYNAGHINSVSFDAQKAYSHWELESLPSGTWGYTHFTNTVRFARTSGLDFLAQTGKFHTMWGDFHSFKNLEALQYECFRMLAYNAKCLVGDQLNPDGKLSEPVYDLIGKVYGEVELMEPWCRKAKPVVDIAVFTPESLYRKSGCGGAVPASVNGCCTMLDEMGYQLDIVEARSDFSKYKVLILPDEVFCDEPLANKIEQFVQAGGTLLATNTSGTDRKGTSCMLPSLGIEFEGPNELWPDFIIPNEILGKGLPVTEHVMYLQGQKINPLTAKILLETKSPYFTRTWEHFCSHRHTPSSGEKGSPAAVMNGRCIYFAHPVFSIYHSNHPRWCKTIIRDALGLLLPDPILKSNGPTTMVATVNEQVEDKRFVLHVLHYIPLKNSEEMYTIEDIIPLYNISFSLNVDKPIKGIRLVPELTELPYALKDGRVEFIVPSITGHALIELHY
jgi:hypothetical protein